MSAGSHSISTAQSWDDSTLLAEKKDLGFVYMIESSFFPVATVLPTLAHRP